MSEQPESDEAPLVGWTTIVATTDDPAAIAALRRRFGPAARYILRSDRNPFPHFHLFRRSPQ